jgi:hypothetical protein
LKKKKKGKIHPSSPHVRLALSSSCYCTPDVYTVLSVLLSRYFLSPALTCRLTAATFPNGEKKKQKILFLLIFLLDQTETTHQKNVFFFLFFSKEIYDWKEETKIRFSPRKLSCMCVEESVYISGDTTSMAPSSPLGCLPCVWGCSITGLVSNKFVPHFPPFLFLSSSSLRPYSG